MTLKTAIRTAFEGEHIQRKYNISPPSLGTMTFTKWAIVKQHPNGSKFVDAGWTKPCVSKEDVEATNWEVHRNNGEILE